MAGPHRVLFLDVPYCSKRVCPEEHHNCVRLVEPDRVLNAASELIQNVAFTILPPVSSKTDESLRLPKKERSPTSSTASVPFLYRV